MFSSLHENPNQLPPPDLSLQVCQGNRMGYGSYLSKMAFSCCRSLSITGCIPSIRNSYRRWRRNSRLSLSREDKLIRWSWFPQDFPMNNLSPSQSLSHISCNKFIWNYCKDQSSKKGLEDMFFFVFFFFTSLKLHCKAFFIFRHQRSAQTLVIHHLCYSTPTELFKGIKTSESVHFLLIKSLWYN